MAKIYKKYVVNNSGVSKEYADAVMADVAVALEGVNYDSDYIDENALSVTVKRLRDKLGADCIGTVYGMGYVWKGVKK